MTAPASLRSDLGRARGLGAAHSGVQHWMSQRLTGIALIPLIAFLLISFLCAADNGTSYESMVEWVSELPTALALILLLAVAFAHGALGLQVVIEDYVPGLLPKTLLLITVKFSFVLLALLGIVAVLFLLLGA